MLNFKFLLVAKFSVWVFLQILFKPQHYEHFMWPLPSFSVGLTVMGASNFDYYSNGYDLKSSYL